jgi:hypothetical protein
VFVVGRPETASRLTAGSRRPAEERSRARRSAPAPEKKPPARGKLAGAVWGLEGWVKQPSMYRLSEPKTVRYDGCHNSGLDLREQKLESTSGATRRAFIRPLIPGRTPSAPTALRVEIDVGEGGTL